MNHAYIDSASLMNAVGGLASFRDFEDWNEWTRQSIYDVTMLSITNFLTIAPSQQSQRSIDSHLPGILYSCYDKALYLLQNVSEYTIPQSNCNGNEKYAHANFFNWLNKSMRNDEMLDKIKRTKDEPCYRKWIEWAIEEAWVDHCRRQHDGLFNKNQIDILSCVLNVPKEDLERLRVKTKENINCVKKWSKDKNRDDGDFELARDAYVVSAVLRGKYHEEISKANKRSYQFHPIRKHVLEPLDEGTKYWIPEPMKYLISIIVTAPCEEKEPRDRVSIWAENVVKVREAYRLKQLDPRLIKYQKIDENVAVKIAIDTAKELRFRIYPKYKEDLIDIVAIISKGCAGPILSLKWSDLTSILDAADILSDIGINQIEKEKSLGKVIMEYKTLKDMSIHNLAKAQAGRIVHSPQGIDWFT